MTAAVWVVGLFTVAPGRRVKPYDVLVTGPRSRNCVREVFFVLASDAALLLAMKVQQEPQVFPQVVDSLARPVDREVCGVRIRGRDVVYELSDAAQFVQELFAVEEPWIGQLLGFSCHDSQVQARTDTKGWNPVCPGGLHFDRSVEGRFMAPSLMSTS